MCDTLVVRQGGVTWLGKNSDREPDEEQVVEVVTPVRGDPEPGLNCTYIRIDQVPDRHGMVLSRPAWMWGAEMGVNDAGVAIGNEAIFSRRVVRQGEALLGMDLLRLGLERGDSAAGACRVMTDLLERHGQGGPAGYRDKAFRYDNSFLVADRESAFVLETCGRDWLKTRVRQTWSISNTYTIEEGADEGSAGAPREGFGRRHESWLRPRAARARERVALSRARVADCGNRPMSLEALAAILRAHARGDGFEGGSNRDLCMHSGPSAVRPSHTTGSMVVKLAPGEPPRMALTGTPTPCVSLFRPVAFDGSFSVCRPGLWHQGQALLARAATEVETRRLLRSAIASSEPRLLACIEAGDTAAAEAGAQAWDEAWLEGSGDTARAS